MIIYLHYGEEVYDDAYNETFYQKLESIHYKSCLAPLGAIRGLSREKKLPRIRLVIPPNVDVDIGNVAYFKGISKKMNQFTFSNKYEQKIRTIIPEIQIKLLYSILDLNFFESCTHCY